MENSSIQSRIEASEVFLLDCTRNGLAHSYDVISKTWVKPYPEVTGYLLSYFANNSDTVPSKIIDASHYLISIQNENGGFRSFANDNILFTFDTAQILYGFLSLYRKNQSEKYLSPSNKCIAFLSMMQADDGRIHGAYNAKGKAIENLAGGFYSGSTAYSIQCKIIESLIESHCVLKDDKCKSMADKLFEYCSSEDYFLLTHPLGYFLEGLTAYGRDDMVKDILVKDVIPRIESDGFIAYSPTLSYAYVSGSLQLGILLYKNGFKEHAYNIAEWASRVQSNHSSGGLFQYANRDASLNHDVHTEINSWGTKYYCELNRLFLKDTTL